MTVKSDYDSQTQGGYAGEDADQNQKFHGAEMNRGNLSRRLPRSSTDYY
jgi:hypothetical protein